MPKQMAGLAAVIASLPLFFASTPALTAGPLSVVQSWSYQLQGLDIDAMAATDYDLIVIDYSRDGTAGRVFSASDIAALKIKPDGSRRIVLSYFSIGEAEDYRFYWQQSWHALPPDWLLAENPDWKGNYDVRYWDPQWRSILLGSPASYLDSIISAGFDGVYLDRVDAFERNDPRFKRVERLELMANLVSDIARYARDRVPGFLVVPQNGEELLANASYRETIDATAKEDLLYGIDTDEERNSNGEIRASLDYLSRLTREGKPVFLAEYLSSPESVAQAHADADALEMVLFIGNRELNDAISR